MSINKRIKAVRMASKLSQIEFAKRIRISQPSLSDIESEKTINIDERNIRLICQEFDVNEGWLRSGEGPMLMNVDESLITLLGNKISAMSDRQKKAVIEFVKLPGNQQTLIIDFIKKMTK